MKSPLNSAARIRSIVPPLISLTLQFARYEVLPLLHYPKQICARGERLSPWLVCSVDLPLREILRNGDMGAVIERSACRSACNPLKFRAPFVILIPEGDVDTDMPSRIIPLPGSVLFRQRQCIACSVPLRCRGAQREGDPPFCPLARFENIARARSLARRTFMLIITFNYCTSWIKTDLIACS